MTESQAGTPVSLRELTELLHESAEQATFDVSGQGTYSASQFRDVYYRNVNTELNRQLLASAKLRVREDCLLKLTRCLRSLLNRYILDEQIGNGFSYFLGGIAVWQVTDVVADAVKAAVLLGQERTAQLLCRWESGEPIPYRKCAVLFGASIDHPFVTDGGARFEMLPQSSADLPGYLPFDSTFYFSQVALLGAVKMTIDCEAKPAFYKPEGHNLIHERTSAYGPFWLESLDAFCEALSLIGNHHISWKVQWSECDQARDFGLGVGSGVSFTPEDTHGNETSSLSQQHVESALELFKGWSNDGNKRKNLDQAISRWMRSKKRRAGYVDQFIELRIALESLYLKGADGELGFRVANYGAWHLGDDLDQRRQYQDTLRRAYAHASRAVHAGEVKDTQETRELLTAAQDLCRKGILKRLKETKEPRWNEMILGREN